MRYGYGLGLVSLLVVTGIILFAFSKTEIPKIRKGQEIKEQFALPYAGKTAEGVRAQDSIQVQGVMNGGQLQSLLVTDVTPDGYFEQYYGIKKGDKILQVNGNDLGMLGGTEMAEAVVWDAKLQPITIIRSGQKLILNSSDGTMGRSGGTPGTATPLGNSAAPASPSSPAPGTGSGIPGLPDSIQVPQK